MLAKYLSTALIGSALMVAPAFAQSTSSSSSNSQEINASTTGDWQASQLIRLNVYNNSNEKIGDIKELMMKKDGQIDQVVIGVGGFLGIGTRDVAIKFSELKFEDQPVPSSTTTSSRPATSGAGAAGGGTAGGATSAPAKKNYPDHAVLNMSKDQLQSMPQFNYSK